MFALALAGNQAMVASGAAGVPASTQVAAGVVGALLLALAASPDLWEPSNAVETGPKKTDLRLTSPISLSASVV